MVSAKFPVNDGLFNYAAKKLGGEYSAFEWRDGGVRGRQEAKFNVPAILPAEKAFLARRETFWPSLKETLNSLPSSCPST